MPCGAVVYFDEDTDAAIRRLWQVIEDAGLLSTIPALNYPPHLTLAACDDMDFDGLRARLPPFVASHPPMVVQFSGLGFFHGRIPVVYLTVTVTHALLDLHSSFDQTARPYLLNPNSYYWPDTWVPHITLAQEFPPETTGAIVNALLRRPLPKIGLLRELALVDFPPEQSGLRELFTTRLGRYL